MKDGRITFLIEKELKADFVARIRQLYKQDTSSFFTAVIRQVMGQKPIAHEVVAEVTDDPDQSLGDKITIRLRGTELKEVMRRAKIQGMSRAKWVVTLIRAHLTQEPQFNEKELLELTESYRQLAAIGTNLNQIARKLNTSLNNADLAKAIEIEAVVQEIRQHNAKVARYIQMNTHRWSINAPRRS